MPSAVSLNGIPCAPEGAKLSVLDRGFLYGDSVYEVMRTYEGVPFELERHLQRLEESARRIGMALPCDLATIEAEVWATHESSGNRESYLRVVCTRGSGEISLDPAVARDPQRIVIAQPLNAPPPVVYEDGVRVALVGVRRNLKAAIDPQAKTGNYLNSVMAFGEARRGGFYEAIMLDHRDLVTEGASSNVFAVFDGILVTPPLEAGILKGVTRTVVTEVCAGGGLKVLNLPLTEAALLQADEVFITSSIREIVPVIGVGDVNIGAARPGPVYREARGLFAAFVSDYCASHRRAL
ncbi:MAG: aminotransferase class IV [Deltaproteobacteria bacterium]|nr:aminotransferase class IV [Deltaproteobacteria bacterium]